MPTAKIAPRLHEVLRYHAEKVVYVTAGAGVSWGEFLQVVDRVWPEADIVSIITPQVQAQHSFCIGPSCGQCTEFRSAHQR